jgi:hypothetical protein
MYWTGVYRFLNSKNFAKEKGIGFALEINFTVTPLILQILNNPSLTSSEGVV